MKFYLRATYLFAAGTAFFFLFLAVPAYSQMTQECSTSNIATSTLVICFYDTKVVPESSTLLAGGKVIFRNESSKPMQVRLGRGGMARPVSGRVEYSITYPNPTTVSFVNTGRTPNQKGTIKILSREDFMKKQAQATKQKASQPPKLDFYITGNKTSYVLGEKVYFVWDLKNVDANDLHSCGVVSNGDFTQVQNSYAGSLVGSAVGEPVRPTVTYTATCKLKKQPSPLFIASVKVSVNRPSKPIIRDMKILTPKGNRAGTEQVLAFTWSSAGSVMDCGAENLNLGNLRRAKDDLPYVDQMYIKSEWPIKPLKSGRCTLKTFHDVKKEDQGTTAVLEFAVTGTPPPDPKKFNVTNISKPTDTPYGPGSYRYFEYDLDGYYLMSGNLPSVTDLISGDVNCMRAFRNSKVSNIPLKPYSRKVALEFAPGKTSYCKYEVRSRPTGQSQVINFTLNVGPPTPPQIQNVNVLSPHGVKRGSVQYIDFIVGAESYEIVGKTSKDNCRPPLLEVSLDPDAPQNKREYEDSSLAYYKHVTYPVQSDKSMTCMIKARTKNKVANYAIDVNYPDSGSVNMTFNLDSKTKQGLVGTQPNLLYIDQSRLISDNAANLISNNSANLIGTYASGLNSVTPLTNSAP